MNTPPNSVFGGVFSFSIEGLSRARLGETKMTIDERLEKIETMLNTLIQRQTIKAYYTVEEFAQLVGKSCFTCREWARLGRVRAEKRQSGRGAHAEWVFSHAELERYQRDGLIPITRQ